MVIRMEVTSLYGRTRLHNVRSAFNLFACLLVSKLLTVSLKSALWQFCVKACAGSIHSADVNPALMSAVAVIAMLVYKLLSAVMRDLCSGSSFKGASALSKMLS